MLWVAALTCFFDDGAFCYCPAMHLARDDVASDGSHLQSVICIYLKRSKTEQFHQGAAIYVGAIDNDLCLKGNTPGPFFRFSDGTPH